jgi:hypothetical protein
MKLSPVMKVVKKAKKSNQMRSIAKETPMPPPMHSAAKPFLA